MAKRKPSRPHSESEELQGIPSSVPEEATSPHAPPAKGREEVSYQAPPLPEELLCRIRFRPGGAIVDTAGQPLDDDDWQRFSAELKRLFYELPDAAQEGLARRSPPVDVLFRCTRRLFVDKAAFLPRAKVALARLTDPTPPEPEGWTIDIGRVQIGPVEPRGKSDRDSATATQQVIDLAREVMPQDPEAVVERLRLSIEDAQRNIPSSRADKEAFVESVNRLLEFLQYRIHVPDLGECKLIVRPGYKDKGYIQFQPSSGGSFGPFETRAFSLVPKGSKT